MEMLQEEFKDKGKSMIKPKLLTKNLEKYYEDKRAWQGIPSIEVTENGRIFIAFYSGGDNEQLGNYCLLLQDDGQGFSQPTAVADAGDFSRCFDPCLWIDDKKKLYFFWASMPDVFTWASICENPDEPVLKWSEPFIVCEGIMLNKPIIKQDGKWLFPVSIWHESVNDSMLKVCDKITINPNNLQAMSYAVTGNKETGFEFLGGARSKLPSFDEHMFLENNDKSITMFIRTKGEIEKAVSFDGGLTWSQPIESGIKHPNSRFFVSRLKSGRVLFVNHHNYKGRNNLTALLYENDGITFCGSLLLDERNKVSYPDAVEAKNGFIYVVYDRERGAKNQNEINSAKEILMAKFTEEELLKSEIFNAESKLKIIISKLY